jgi:ADP-heptose:LPS heptosyltransferase
VTLRDHGLCVGSFLERTRGAQKIIVVDLGFLGDSIHLIPALWEIKRHYPRAQLHTLSSVVGAEVLRLAPCVDRPWAFPLTEKSPPWWRHWDILLALRRERFDVAFNLSGSDRSIFMTAVTGARWRLGYQAGRSHFWNRWLIADWASRERRDVPIFEQRRQALAASGFSLEAPRFDLRLPDGDQEWAAANIPEKSIHLSINASTPLKEWPMRHWIALARLLLSMHPAVSIVATASSKPREQQRLNELCATAKDPRLRGFAGLTLGQLGALLRRTRAHIGADSGVLHLALALGTPTVSVFRQYEGLDEWRPAGARHRSIVVRCPCAETGRADCLTRGESECLGGISPERVFAEIQAVGESQAP